MSAIVEPLVGALVSELEQHLTRHYSESGTDGDIHFMPYEPGTHGQQKPFDAAQLDLSVTEIGWERWWVLKDHDHIGGHVILTGERVVTGLHRCMLAIGIERAYRSQGHGKSLMLTALTFARQSASIDYVDLQVFAHNTAGIRLYKSLGFVETGKILDRFRISGDSIDDISMSLKV